MCYCLLVLFSSLLNFFQICFYASKSNPNSRMLPNTEQYQCLVIFLVLYWYLNEPNHSDISMDNFTTKIRKQQQETKSQLTSKMKNQPSKSSAPLPKILLFLATAALLFNTSVADPRIHTVKIICRHHSTRSSPAYAGNFVAVMNNISSQIRVSGYGQAAQGTGTDASYGLAQCYGDLSTLDCNLCYAQARTLLPQCLPGAGARLYLDGCFMRVENYNFYEEYLGQNDSVLCGNKTMKDQAFQDAARKAVVKAVVDAQSNKWYAREKVAVAGTTGNGSVYVLANCWKSLNSSACNMCLQNASSSMLGCLPSSEGRALNTGCFMRYSDFDFLNKESKNRNSKGTVIIVVESVVSSLVVLAVAAAAGVHCWKLRIIKKKRRRGLNDTEKSVHILHDSSLNFKYSTLEKATGVFSEENKLGQGGFGTVYKGVLADGREIAVKRLFFNSKHRAADFYNEVNIISSVDHKNLVRLLGCSCSGPESLLVYEFLPNKSLDRFIFDPIRGRALNWKKRYDIIIGTAEGLVYLHENKNARIIHRDIKASNILLDSKFHAKIADFGLARSFQDDKSHISTAIAGTLGYMAPEYLAHGQLTEKADVYSFGVLLLEIVTGKQNNKSKATEYSESVLTNVWKHFQQGTVEELFDPNLMLPNYENANIKDKVLRVVHIGLLCTQEARSLRPIMSRALQMLREKDGHLPSPTSPPFTDERTMEIHDICENPCHPLKADS